MNLIEKLSIGLSALAVLTGTAFAGVTISSPGNGAQVYSPFTLSADATKCSSQRVTSMGYSLDSSTQTTTVEGTSIEASVAASAGEHTVHVMAWGAKGASCVTDVAITVDPPAVAPEIPVDAISVSSIQVLSGWLAAGDAAGDGTSTGSTQIVSSPSLSGSAREFVTKYTNAGDERFSVTFGDDTTSTNFLYDAWVYLNRSASNIANLEMDMNQVMANGQTVIYGFQCDGYSGTWDYTANTGTPESPVDVWVHSNAACNVSNWSRNTWHHVQVGYFRDDAGNVTYQAVYLDGVESEINATAPSAFALGWAPVLLTNFEIDGLGSEGSATVYLDDLTVYRW